MIKFSNFKKYINFLSFIFIISFSFMVNFYYGHQGLMPLDDLQNFNSGHRILKGDFPFRDYYSITGPFLDLTQYLFYKIFGSSWGSLVIHASTINSMFAASIFIFFKKLNFTSFECFIFSICSGLLMYPPAGNPTVEHSSLIFSLIGMILFFLGIKENKKFYISISAIIFTLSFFIKQVPTVYFIVFCFLIYLFKIFGKRNSSSLLVFIFTGFSSTVIVLFFFKINNVSLNEILDQYIYIAATIGENRFSNINFGIFYDKISKIFFLCFLLIPTIYLAINKKNIHPIVLIFGLVFILCFYELHSNNQPISFGTLPFIIGLFYYLTIRFEFKSNIVKYFFYFLIIYCIFRILRFEIYYTIFLIIFLSLIPKFSSLFKFSLIIYLLITTCFYFEKYIKIRSWDDLNKEDLDKYFEANIIDKKLGKLKWKTVYYSNSKEELKLILETIKYLKSVSSDKNYLLITEYQIYNLILDKRDFSPVKYWHLGVSYPSKTHPKRFEFELFFKNKFSKYNIDQIIFDNTADFKSNHLHEFKWLEKCVYKKESHQYLDIFYLKKNCIS